MRETKFRAKRLDDGEWVYGSLLHQTDHYGEKVNRWFIIDGTETQDYDIGFEYEVDENTIGQYTGFKDKNDVEIYEGDVVKSNYHTDVIDLFGKFVPGSFTYHPKGATNVTSHYLISDLKKVLNLEVIGKV